MGAARGTAATRRSAGCCSRATPTATSPPAGAATPTDDAATARFEELAARARRAASASSARRSGRPSAWAGRSATRPADARRAARFDRDLDWRWRRTSYSDITAGAHEARVASEPEERVVDDEEPDAAAGAASPATTTEAGARGRAVAARGDAGRRPTSARSCTASSRRPTSPRPTSTPSSTRQVAAVQRAAAASTIGDPAAVVGGPARGDRDAARPAARRPSGCATSRAATGSTSSTSSCRWSAATTPTGRARRSAAIAARAARHLPPDDPLAGYAERLDDPALRQQRARLPDRQHRPRRPAAAAATRFAVVDYKTNWLGAAGRGR